jgi:hypothetical protein
MSVLWCPDGVCQRLVRRHDMVFEPLAAIMKMRSPIQVRITLCLSTPPHGDTAAISRGDQDGGRPRSRLNCREMPLLALHYRRVSPASMTSPISGSNGKRVWRLVALIAILAVVIGTTAGELWHRHVNCSPETCPICHLSHQAVELPVAAASAQTLVIAGQRTEPSRPAFPARFVVSHLPVRAPPA